MALMACGNPHEQPVDDGSAEREPIVGLPCEGCEAIFQGLPLALDWQARIAPLDEPGETLRIEGTVRDAAGRAIPGIVVYAYHTDAHGIYPRDPSFADTEAYRHGRLRGWASTDSLGRYRFDTIRPASYPNTNTPAHVHLHVLEPGRCTYYIDDVLFDDDPHLTDDLREQLTLGRGGPGIAVPEGGPSTTWSVNRDIILGERIPGYPERPSR